MYRSVTTLLELLSYLSGANVVAFDFETAPDALYRNYDKAALDPHQAHVAGISFSVAEDNAVYLPLAHRSGGNAIDQEGIWDWLAEEFFQNASIVKVAHNLAFEASFLYARDIVVQEPCYDTIAAAQLVYKNEGEFRGLGDSGLKKLAQEYFNASLPSFADTVGSRHFDELDPTAETTIRYACSDSDYTLRLYYMLNNWFDRFLPKHRYVVEHIESLMCYHFSCYESLNLSIIRTGGNEYNETKKGI